MAARQGMLVRRFRVRDVNAIDYGRYLLVDAATNHTVLGGNSFVTLDDIEKFLQNPRKRGLKAKR